MAILLPTAARPMVRTHARIPDLPTRRGHLMADRHTEDLHGHIRSTVRAVTALLLIAQLRRTAVQLRRITLLLLRITAEEAVRITVGAAAVRFTAAAVAGATLLEVTPGIDKASRKTGSQGSTPDDLSRRAGRGLGFQ